jgi:hypothetical protein
MQSQINKVIIIDTHCSSKKMFSKMDKTKKLLEELLTINLNQSTE